MSPERAATFNRSASQFPIAITGLGCRLPGCNSPAEYWEMILAGECRVAPAPAERFDRDLYYYPERGELNRSYTDLACTIDYRGATPTHPSLPASVRSCPELAFTTLYLAVDQALRGDQQFGQATAPQSLPPRTGVYVGHTRKSGLAGQMIVGTYIPQIIQYLSEVNGISDEQRERVAESLRRRFRDAAPRRSAAGQPDLTSLTAAGLISQGLGLDGPAMVFNSACASSLQALAQAVRALQLGTIDAAIVGSASYFHADTLVLFSQAQSLSAVGSHPFDISADGIVVGEGYAAVVLRREADAIAAQLPRHATIRGVGISSDGKGKSLWAPRAEGQKLAVARAYSGIADSHAPQYIEAHATGTQLGDATELTAIAASLQSRQIEQPIAVGSVKSNIGHTLETAGLAGLIKAVLSVREGVIPPTTGVSQLNPKIDWETVPFHIPTWAQTWPELAPAVPRRAAINAFGIGGLNVHVVIDAAQTSPVSASPTQTNAGSPNPTDSLSGSTASVEQIAIVGMGMIAAGCANVEAFWQRLASGEAALRDVPPTRWQADLFCDPQHVRPWHTTTTRGGYVTDFTYDWRRHRIPPKQIAHASPVQFMVLEAVEQALKQSFGEELQQAGGLNKLAERTGVIVGTTFGGDFANQLLLGLRLPEFEQTIRHTITDLPSTEVEAIVDQFHDTVLRHMPALLDETGSFTSSSLASRITKTFDLFGGAVAVDGGLCSAAASLQCAVDLLRSGDNDMMICVAAQEDMSPTRFELMSLSGDLATTPEGNGLVPGEGCVAFVLRRLSDAERDQQPILGRIGAIDAHFDHTRRATRPPTLAQRLIGHTLGAAGHIELLSALAPQAPHPPSTRVESADFSGLHYKIELFCAKYSIDEAQSATISPAIQTHVMAPRQDSKILQFDATQRRKLRLRERAMSGKQPQPGSSASQPSTAADQPLNPPPLNPPPQQPIATQPVAAQATAASLTSEINGHPQPTPAGLPPAKLRQLLVDFVVEQTGYPTDMVELDADLEADLGLDSIKKAQLLGEVGEHYALADRNDVDLDQLNTLAAIEAFLLALPTGSPTENPMGNPMGNAQPLASFPGSNVTGTPSKNGSSHAEHAADPQQPVQHQLAQQQQPVQRGAEPQRTADELRAAVELKMTSFVVDQTGYPPDMVELDADLEADLGIDSIRKAQLLGELAETFGLQADEATSLDELPSLRAILDFTCQQLAGNAPPAQGTQQPSAHPVAPAPAPVPQAPAPVPQTAVPAAQASAPVSQTPASVSAKIDAGLLREKMIEFVVEQTGYPLEMVELDADLEADLGIDSIKKAQLMGELQETYQFATRDDMTLDDFPDLASIERFVLEMCAPQGSVARSRF